MCNEGSGDCCENGEIPGDASKQNFCQESGEKGRGGLGRSPIDSVEGRMRPSTTRAHTATAKQIKQCDVEHFSAKAAPPACPAQTEGVRLTKKRIAPSARNPGTPDENLAKHIPLSSMAQDSWASISPGFAGTRRSDSRSVGHGSCFVISMHDVDLFAAHDHISAHSRSVNAKTSCFSRQ
jgi:hypothetical protein